MADRTAIEWAANADGSPGASWNPIRARRRSDGKGGWFCVRVSDGCRNCYAERLNVGRFGNGLGYKAQNAGEVEIYLDEKTLTAPLRWRKPRTIFVCSMSDLFGAFVPDAFIDKVFAVAALCQQHTFIVLTKRAQHMRAWFHAKGLTMTAWARPSSRPGTTEPLELLPWPLPNVWLGVSVEDQKNADERIPDLLATPAERRFISAEPLLGPLDLSRWELDWVIVGGESGPDARLMRPDWARSLRDQCAAAGTPFFFKQWGSWAPWPHWSEPRTEATPPIIELRRVGKARAGRLLDGAEHNARPPLAHQPPLQQEREP